MAAIVPQPGPGGQRSRRTTDARAHACVLPSAHGGGDAGDPGSAGGVRAGHGGAQLGIGATSLLSVLSGAALAAFLMIMYIAVGLRRQEVLGGFHVIRADDMGTAIAPARACPEDVVEVREQVT
jgi:hypothetical protein